MPKQNLKQKIFFLTIIFCGVFGLVGTSFGATINAASCSYADVSSAVSSASAQDTVIVQACSETTWNSPLIITKGITIQGAGIDQTNIKAGFSDAYNGVISYKPNSTERDVNNPVRITGFTIDGNSFEIGVYIENDSAAPLKEVTKIRVDHNRIKNANRAVYVFGAAYGVADNNTIENCGHGMDGEGTGSNYEWANMSRAFGNAKNFYFEDNTFSGNFVYHAGGHGGRYVARYNTYNMISTENLLPTLDVHGNQYAGYGMMINEVYGNKFNMKYTNNGNYLIDQRGSWLLAFNNNVSTDTGTTEHYIRTREEFGDSWSDSPSGNPGAYLMHVNNSYFWNNRLSSNSNAIIEGNLSEECCGEDAGYGQSSACCYNTGGTVGIAENIDWFNQNTAYNGTTQRGVYCGTTLPGNCTVGDGAWITTQSCLNTTNMTGVDPSTPISGTFYKCTATNTWMSYYTPYTYPHPLRNESGDDTPPSVPSGLSVE